jgi:hypothetical protein
MAHKKKAARFTSTALKKNNPSNEDYTVRSIVKTLIVRLAIWGLIPASLARWLIQRGGLADA